MLDEHNISFHQKSRDNCSAICLPFLISGRFYWAFFASLVGLVSYKSLFSPFILRFDNHEGTMWSFCCFHGACRLQTNKKDIFLLLFLSTHLSLFLFISVM